VPASHSSDNHPVTSNLVVRRIDSERRKGFAVPELLVFPIMASEENHSSDHESVMLDSKNLADEKLSSHVDEAVPVTYFRLHTLIHNIHDYSVINTRKTLMLVYVFLIMVYIGLFVALLAANFKSQEFIEDNYYLAFHLSSFWGVAVFTVLEAFILVAADAIIFTWEKWWYFVGALLILINVVASFTAALLFSLDPEVYEVESHYIEYSTQILISSINFVFIFSYLGTKSQTSVFYRYRYLEMLIAFLVLVLSIIQLFIYSGVLKTPMEAERAAHFVEFANEIFNGLFALLYAVATYLDIKEKVDTHYTEMHKTV
jgi:hypothetical protein